MLGVQLAPAGTNLVANFIILMSWTEPGANGDGINVLGAEHINNQ